MTNEVERTEDVETRKIESGVSGTDLTSEVEKEIADVSETERPEPEKKTRKSRKPRKSPKTKAKAETGKKEKAKSETRETFSAFDLSARVRENSKARGVGAKPLPKADSEKERPYRSPERNNTFRVAFALSLSDREAKAKKVREVFPLSAEFRERLKKAGIDVGKGYTTKSLSSALSTLKLSGFPGFSGFSPKSTRFAVSLSDTGSRVLRFPGFNNSGDVPE